MAPAVPTAKPDDAPSRPSSIVWHRCPRHQTLFNPKLGCMGCASNSDMTLRGEHFEFDAPRELDIPKP